MNRTRTAFGAVTLATAVAAGCLVTASAAGAASAKPVLREASVSPEGTPLAAAVKAYRTAYPKLTQAQALTAAQQQDARHQLSSRLTSGAAAATFGGAWFDVPTGTVHVAATTAAAGQSAAAQAKALGLKVTTHTVRRSFTQLEAAANQLRAAKSDFAKQVAGQVGIDVTTNQVTAALSPSSARSFAAAKAVPAGVEVVATRTGVQADAGCTARNACDWTIRAGSMIWTGSAGNNVCSVGFTARTSSNQRYVYTAGHCSGGNGITWGTGALPIGPMVASINTGAYDASIIQVTNGWFASDQGGEIYKTVYVNGVAPTLGYIWSGDTVCLSANYTNPTGPNYCGVIGTNSDASVRGMARVDGLDACGGDSGGGWYWLTSSGRRIAYGMHSRSDIGCHGDSGGSHSWFSPLPTVKSGWTPGLNVEVRP